MKAIKSIKDSLHIHVALTLCHFVSSLKYGHWVPTHFCSVSSMDVVKIYIVNVFVAGLFNTLMDGEAISYIILCVSLADHSVTLDPDSYTYLLFYQHHSASAIPYSFLVHTFLCPSKNFLSS